jgi:hypothetical protein
MYQIVIHLQFYPAQKVQKICINARQTCAMRYGF